MRRRVMAIGLDCADPRQSWGMLAGACPNLAALCARGRHGPLPSTTPPITVPAWASMLSGVSPGELGLYGLRNRVAGTYGMRVASAADVKVPRVWDVLAATGRRAIMVGVPQTYPPASLPRGEMVSCFLTPSAGSAYTEPASLKPELERLFGEYRMDVEGFRAPDRARILRDIQAMTEQRFAIARHLARTRDWDFLMMVDMGIDRFHHAFWQTWNLDHPAHDPASPWLAEAARYYALVDRCVGELVAEADEDTAIVVLSDHGARSLRGGICVNEVLIEAGLLTLVRRPTAPTRLDDAEVDWDRTVAWAEGGYYARVFLNVQGREPRGVLDPSARERVRDEIDALLRAVPGLDGRALETRVLRPEQLYARCAGTPPDLMVFFDDLGYRAIGTVGQPAHAIATNDTGPDGCNHDWNGLWALASPWDDAVRIEGIQDVGAALLDLLAVPRSARPPALGGST